MNKNIERRRERREAQVAEGPILLRDAFKIIETRALPDIHEQEMLQLFVNNSRTVKECIGERFSLGVARTAEELAYARSVVQNAVFQAAAKHEYVVRDNPSGRGTFVAANTPQGVAAFSDAINVSQALSFMMNMIRHIKKDSSCSDVSYHEISVQAADTIVPVSRALSNMSANQVQKFMEFATTDRVFWTVEKTEYDYNPGFLSVERGGSKISIRPTKEFREYLELAQRMNPVSWDREGTASCPMFETKGKDDAYRLLLQSLQLTFKKIEDVKAQRTDTV